MFTPTRDEARAFLVEAWRKYKASEPMAGLEQVAVGLIARHPEYHGVMEDGERHLDRDYTPESGAINPFLHLSLHLAVAEQLSIDQPPGIRAHYGRLCIARGDEHAALHAVVDCLAETLWQAQRNATGPDATGYLACLAAQR